MSILVLLYFSALFSFCSCQFQELYWQCTGKLVGLQELGNAWSLIVGGDNFVPIAEFIAGLNQAIAEESLRQDVDVTINIAMLLCDAHGVVFDMINQFRPSHTIGEDLLQVFKEKLWNQWLGAINRFNIAICALSLPKELQEAALIRIDLASMKPVKIQISHHGKFERIKSHLKGLRDLARSSINRLLEAK